MDGDIAGPCKVRFIPEFGVIRLRGAPNETHQRGLWNFTKPFAEDPKGKGGSSTCFNFMRKSNASQFYFYFHPCGIDDGVSGSATQRPAAPRSPPPTPPLCAGGEPWEGASER